MCSYPYKKESEWWSEGNKVQGIFYGELATYLSTAWKSITNAAAMKGEPKPYAPCCCKCNADKRIQCQAKCMKSKENEFKVQFEGHKYERSHWVWCGFACLACQYNDVPATPSCVGEEVMEREMKKQSNNGDDTHMPAWWMSVQRNMVISSQKAQGLEPDGEPCPLGFESKQEGSPANAAVPGGKDEQAAFAAEEKNKPCGFMCRMKKDMSSAKSKTEEQVSKEPSVTQASIEQKNEKEEMLQETMQKESKIRRAAEVAGEKAVQ
jgi:hypothetical protein